MTGVVCPKHRGMLFTHFRIGISGFTVKRFDPLQTLHQSCYQIFLLITRGYPRPIWMATKTPSGGDSRNGARRRTIQRSCGVSFGSHSGSLCHS